MGVLRETDLEKCLHKLFPSSNILRNVRKQAFLGSINPGAYLELDFWLPEEKIAFEFQDRHHYVETWNSSLPLAEVKKRDAIKLERAHKLGETLITVPCWWDGTVESLIATIRMKRSDLFTSAYASGTPIDNEPPPGFFAVSAVPDVGELMLASYNLTNQFLCKDWWISEKYDGIRACWNPTNAKLFSRHGRVLALPASGITKFSSAANLFMDGELWFGRSSFVEVQKLMPKEPGNVLWEKMRYSVFDCPPSESSLEITADLPYESRYAALLHISPEHPFIQLCAQQTCQDEQHLKSFTEMILGNGGEGSITRMPASVYEHGRSTSLIKLKASRMDMEARIIQLDDENITLEMVDGSVVSTQRLSFLSNNETNLQVNNVVTFSFSSSFKSENMAPVLSSVRHDLVWDDVVADYIADIPRKQNANAYTERALSKLEPTQRPSGYWTREEGANIRVFFDDFARSRNLDPLIPETWYSVTVNTIASEGGISALKQSSGLASLLASTYPDIGLDASKFQYSPRSYWQAPDNRKRFFDSLAEKKGFDPLIALNWYSVSSTDIMNEKGGNSILAFYGKSIAQALMTIYPDIGLQQAKFSHAPHKYYHDIVNQKIFFDNFAAKQGFDPMLPHNWYSISTVDIKLEKGGAAIIRLYGESLIRALVTVYPNIGLNKLKFKNAPRGHWTDLENQRQYFEDFAKRNGFDHLIPNSWYLHKESAKREGASILKYYRGSLYKALATVFPTIPLNKAEFTKRKG